MSSETDGLVPLKNKTALLKPLMKGWLTGELYAILRYCDGLCLAYLADFATDPQRLSAAKMAHLKRLQLNLGFGATYTTAKLGVFEILTKRMGAADNGRPLPLGQEACFGLVSGAIAACVWYPISQNLNRRNLFYNLYHTVRNKGSLALWKGSGLYMSTQLALNMGLLASYNRTLHYLKDTGFRKHEAQLGAGIISGFFATVCSFPCIYLYAIKICVQEKYNAGDKHAYRKIPFYISQILTPGSRFRFYSLLLKEFAQYAPFYVIQWWIYEAIQDMEEAHSTTHTSSSALKKI